MPALATPGAPAAAAPVRWARAAWIGLAALAASLVAELLLPPLGEPVELVGPAAAAGGVALVALAARRAAQGRAGAARGAAALAVALPLAGLLLPVRPLLLLQSGTWQLDAIALREASEGYVVGFMSGAPPYDVSRAQALLAAHDVGPLFVVTALVAAAALQVLLSPAAVAGARAALPLVLPVAVLATAAAPWWEVPTLDGVWSRAAGPLEVTPAWGAALAVAALAGALGWWRQGRSLARGAAWGALALLAVPWAVAAWSADGSGASVDGAGAGEESRSEALIRTWELLDGGSGPVWGAYVVTALISLQCALVLRRAPFSLRSAPSA